MHSASAQQTWCQCPSACMPTRPSCVHRPLPAPTPTPRCCGPDAACWDWKLANDRAATEAGVVSTFGPPCCPARSLLYEA